VPILVDAETRVLIQGITGREAAGFALESIRYGTQIIAGVTPGKGGAQVHGVPVFDSVAAAMRAQSCTASIISVPAPFVRDAAQEALDNGLKLLAIITERIPRKDVVSILEVARERGARVTA
jgi:succinyl-CoA synthetase alpha subunit